MGVGVCRGREVVGCKGEGSGVWVYVCRGKEGGVLGVCVCVREGRLGLGVWEVGKGVGL